MTDAPSRRDMLKVIGLAGAAGLAGRAANAQEQLPPQAPANEPAAQPAPAAETQDVLFFFNDEEAAFIEAAAGRLIPPDEEWGGAAEAGVLYYIDRQLASAYGAGAHMYLSGPWDFAAPPQQGYQLRFPPSELYRIGIAETRQFCRDAHGREFRDLGPAGIDDVLTGLETGSIDLPSMPAPVFFETLLANTVEGFFADPAYGGNRDMVSWRMVGFPGAYAQYLDLVDLFGIPFVRAPISFGNSAERRAHLEAHQHKAGGEN